MKDNRAGSKLPTWSTRESASGVRVDSGPHLAIVKNNSDPARLGRLQVFIPDLGGKEEEPGNWYTINYSSPYLGSTRGTQSADDKIFGNENQTYGFWAVPPDIDNFVLVVFVMGDPMRGYYIASVPNTPALHMLPGIARAINSNETIAQDPAIKGRVDTATDYLPVTELNTNNLERDNAPNFVTIPKSAHVPQANIVLAQGLETDPKRGTITSSAQRDGPSQVFGISTPGRTIPDTTDFPNIEEIPITVLQSFAARKGGHTFVMDDGDIAGKDNLVRLRTAGGHTILMHDTEDIFYIINKTGNAYVELTKNGSINVYGHSDFNLRTRGNISFHADTNINIHAGDTLKIYAANNILSETKVSKVTAIDDYQLNAGKVGIKSDTFISLQSTTGGWLTKADLTLKGRKIYLNTNTPDLPSTNPPLEFYKQVNTEPDSEKKKWKKTTAKFNSICPFTPTHEPWARATGELKLNNGSIVPSSPQTPEET
jgi:Type VI secretion system/phage-baseplate injector OB domain